MGTTQSYSRALETAREARVRFIGLTFDIPDGAPKEILRLWNVADTALLAFVSAMEDLRDLEDSRRRSPHSTAPPTRSNPTPSQASVDRQHAR
jgi:hypothetical protein